MIDGVQKGPFLLSQLADIGVRPSTYIWCDGMDDWEKAEDVADVCRFFRCRILDLMHPSSVEALKRREEEDAPPVQPDAPLESPTVFDRYLPEGEHIPTLEEIDGKVNVNDEIKHKKELPARNTGFLRRLLAVIIILLFPPTGLVAVYFAHKTNMALLDGDEEKAKDFYRSANMWVGITICLALMTVSTLIYCLF